jgi:hypothetical protein
MTDSPEQPAAADAPVDTGDSATDPVETTSGTGSVLAIGCVVALAVALLAIVVYFTVAG